MLEAKNICYGYPGRSELTLDNINIRILPGEIVGLYGPSGQGKTTLARIMSGYLVPDSGQVLVDGSCLPKKGCCPVQLLQQHSELAVNPRWQVKGILAEHSLPSGEVLADLQIRENWMSRYPHELSGGEIQRICVARILAARPAYIIADETTSMLDAIAQAQIWRVLLALVAKRQQGILTISHDYALLEQVCHTIFVFTEQKNIVPESM
ncbi:MAG: ATP-binding cassette domain-containing protein [Candidatus Marinimicrobia bacterium]|nr:ATP-binding cassette domain-containing protein [Candidatus Neomarinimicrobiota bacterium]